MATSNSFESTVRTLREAGMSLEDATSKAFFASKRGRNTAPMTAPEQLKALTDKYIAEGLSLEDATSKAYATMRAPGGTQFRDISAPLPSQRNQPQGIPTGMRPRDVTLPPLPSRDKVQFTTDSSGATQIILPGLSTADRDRLQKLLDEFFAGTHARTVMSDRIVDSHGVGLGGYAGPGR